MKALLICPAERSAAAALSEHKPLALVPALGKTLIEHWLEEVAGRGATEVRILAADRPDQIRAFVGSGARWGMQVEVVPEARELCVEEARAKYEVRDDGTWLPAPWDAACADHFPRFPKFPAFESYGGWFRALMQLLEGKAFAHYIGLREVRPNVWVGRRARVAESAVLEGPCWIGANAWVGELAHIGPMSVIEDGAFVDSGAVVQGSVVMSATYLGRGTELRKSIAYKDSLINWSNGGLATVAERVLLSGLETPHPIERCERLLARLAAFVVLALTLPFASGIAARSWLVGQPPFRLRKAVNPSMPGYSKRSRCILYYELLNTSAFWRRWPQLWNIVQGNFAWVGNRPLTAMQTGRLTSDFERLWLSAPIGLFSLADAEGCVDSLDDEARAHSSFYAIQATRRLRISILRRVLGSVLFTPPTPQPGHAFPVGLSGPAVKQSRL